MAEINSHVSCSNAENTDRINQSVIIESDSVCDIEECCDEKLRRKYSKHDWIKVKDYETLKEAQIDLKKEGFSFWHKIKSDTGFKSCFRCNATKRRNKKECAEMKLIFKDFTNPNYAVYQSESKHTCRKELKKCQKH